MLETINEGFKRARNYLRGVLELTEADIEHALKEVRRSLLEADVEFNVVKKFLAQVKEKAIGEVVQVEAQHQGKKVKVNAEAHFVKICQKELEDLMGPVDHSFKEGARPPMKIMMVGLQGSGKTTTTGKLARYLEKQGKRPLLVAADVYRPAAIEQLKVLGEKLKMPVFSIEGGSPPDICEQAIQYARERSRDVVIFDTAGRLAIDAPLMQELVNIKDRTKPDNILFVCDAMIGQDAVPTAKAFNEALGLSGIILTKLDGDARGGAALSIKEACGIPIKFLGQGEALDKLEEFRPEGLASRILGMGDVVGLMKDFEQVVDKERAEEDAIRMLRGRFGFDDFLAQIEIIQKMGPLKDVFEKMPFFPDGLPTGVNLDDRELTKVKAMISSMTTEERRKPEVFFPKIENKRHAKGPQAGQDFEELSFEKRRVARVSKGSGRPEPEVEALIYKFRGMQKMMGQIGAATGLLDKIPGLKQLKQIRNIQKMAGQMNPGDLEAAQAQMEQMQKMAGRQNPLMMGQGQNPFGLPPAQTSAKPSAKELAKKRQKRKLEKEARKKTRKK
jgi:signal recognition particle subunit SRP54